MSDRKVYYGRRTIEFRTGCRVTLPIGMYDSEAAAKEAVGKLSAAIAEITRMGHLCTSYQMPNGEPVMEPTGMTVQHFLAELGIKSIGHGHAVLPLRSGNDIVVPEPPKLIIP